jgi:hypothetical protein
LAEPPALSARARWGLVIGLLAGAALRISLLPVPGSPDVGSWKIWAYEGRRDPTTLYGVGGSPPERRLLEWNGGKGTTEYPPAALYQMGAAGRVYAAIDPAFRDSPTLTVLIKTPGVVAELAFVVIVLAWRRWLGGSAVWMALAFWLNPAVIVNGAGLGYLDAQMAVPAALALLAAGYGAMAWAGALLALAILTKAQAVFVAPIVVLTIVNVDRRVAWSSLLRATAGGAFMGALVAGPILARGAGPNMLQALGRLGAHDMLSGNALNVWWIVTWIVRATHAVAELGWQTAFTLPVRILGITRFTEVGYPDPKPIGAVLVCAAVLWCIWRTRSNRVLATLALAGGWTVFAYTMLNTQVHENHAYLAIPVLAVAAGLDRALRPLFWTVSSMSALNMYLFYGLGAPWSPMIDRTLTVVDLSVLLALLNVGVFASLTGALLDRTRPPIVVSWG